MAAKPSPRGSGFRRDLPPESLAEEYDAFGHRDYAAAVASILLEDRAPPTLGLFGPWGLGKTTVIEEVGRQLEGKAAFAYFDVWRYEGDALRRQFLRDVAGQLYDKGESDFDPERELIDFEVATTEVKETFGGFSKAAALELAGRAVVTFFLFFTALRVIGSDVLRDKSGALSDATVAGLVAVLLSLVGPFTRIIRFPEHSLARSRLEDPEKFTERFCMLLKGLKRQRLVIAIDNLDRCSPDRVEELLSTIKTYLEPAAQRSKPLFIARLFKKPSIKEAVFVIAADDKALRRHLEAKESAASGRQQSSSEIARYVDEYLRKFFTAAVRIRPLLDADMKVYTERELADFNSEHELDDETRAALIEMVAAALSRNPRRVKQFTNNLEARLRVIKQREDASRIYPRISDQILVIAKLAILEEEWPSSFAALEENPRALDEWQAQVVEGLAPTSPDSDDTAFVRFVSRSRAIRAANLSAFLRLKQSQNEIELPRYADFMGALELGTPDEVEKILTEEAARASEYARLLPTALEDELARKNIEGARAVIEVATSVPKLAGERDVMKTLLTRAVGDGALRAGLRGIRPRPLFEASLLLDAADRQRLLTEFLDLQAFLAESPERLAQILEAFAKVSKNIPKTTRNALSERLATEELAVQFEAILPLAEANPDSIPEEVARTALNKVSEAFDIASPEFRLLRASLHRSSVPDDLKAGLLGLITNVVSAQSANQQEDAAQAEAIFRELAAMAGRLEGVAQSAVEQFFSTTDVPLSTWAPATWPSLLDLLGVIASLAPTTDVPQLTRLVSEFFASTIEEAIAFAARGADSVSSGLHIPLLDQLAAAASGDSKDPRAPAGAAIVALDPADRYGRFRSAVEQCIQRDLFNQARSFISGNAELARPYISDFVGQGLERLRALTDADALRRALGLISELLPAMSDDQRNELRDVLGQLLQSGDEARVTAVAEAMRGLVERDEFEGRARELVKVAFDHLKVSPPAPTATLMFVAEHVLLLGRLERGAFIAHLASLIKDAAQRASAVAAARVLPDLEPADRTEIVGALIDVEIMEATISDRIEYLRLARKIATNRGNAARLVKERLGELARGTDADQEVHKAVLEPTAPTEGGS